MGEYFEITFFDKKTDLSQSKSNDIMCQLGLVNGFNIINSNPYKLLSGREVLFDIFEETDFWEYRICISNCTFTRNQFDSQLTALLEIVNDCFDRIESIVLATGIYELTYYYIENINYLQDFNQKNLSKFPFVFWRGNNIFQLYPEQKYHDISYVVNSGNHVQNIFFDEK